MAGLMCLPQTSLILYRRDHNAIEIFGKVYDEHEGYLFHEAIAIAIDCLQLDIQMRPEMDYVLSRLRNIAIRCKLAGIQNNTDKLHPALISTISMEELNEATRNFNNDVLIGQGPSAKCFLGVLKDGQNFAVKKFDTSKEIQVEVRTILRMCYHDNVVQFLGCFLEGKTCVIAYEYAPRGSLHDILHGKKDVKGTQPGPPLSLLQRVKIAVSAAKGLEFLHDKVDPPIIHGNIKSSNILLFDNDVPKIGDIGVSIYETPNRFHEYFDTALGFHEYYETVWVSRDPTSAWEAPECEVTGRHSRRTDVYSFGVLLLELLTGHEVIDNTTPRGQRSLVTWVQATKGKVGQCIDPRLGGGYPLKAVRKMAAVAALCLEYEAHHRPIMSEVVRFLSPLLDSK